MHEGEPMHAAASVAVELDDIDPLELRVLTPQLCHRARRGAGLWLPKVKGPHGDVVERRRRPVPEVAPGAVRCANLVLLDAAEHWVRERCWTRLLSSGKILKLSLRGERDGNRERVAHADRFEQRGEESGGTADRGAATK